MATLNCMYYWPLYFIEHLYSQEIRKLYLSRHISATRIYAVPIESFPLQIAWNFLPCELPFSKGLVVWECSSLFLEKSGKHSWSGLQCLRWCTWDKVTCLWLDISFYVGEQKTWIKKYPAASSSSNQEALHSTAVRFPRKQSFAPTPEEGIWAVIMLSANVWRQWEFSQLWYDQYNNGPCLWPSLSRLYMRHWSVWESFDLLSRRQYWLENLRKGSKRSTKTWNFLSS